MPTTELTDNEIARLFNEVEKRTANFTNVQPEMLVDNPKYVLVFRLAANMSQNQFERFLGSNSKNTSKYELGKIKNMQISTAERLVQKIKPYLKPANKEQVIKRYGLSRAESNGWFKANRYSSTALLAQRKGAAASLRLRRTNQESEIERYLSRKKQEFFINYPLKENIIVDVYIPKKKLAIECKEITSSSRKELKEQIKFLALQGFKIRYNFKDLTLWALVKTNQRIKENDIQELQAFDKILYDLDELRRSFSSIEVSML